MMRYIEGDGQASVMPEIEVTDSKVIVRRTAKHACVVEAMEEVVALLELIAEEIKAEGWSIGRVRAYVGNALRRSVDANEGDGRKFIAHGRDYSSEEVQC